MTTWIIPPPDEEHARRAFEAVAFEGDDSAANLDLGWDGLVAVAAELGADVLHADVDGDGQVVPYGWNGRLIRISPAKHPLRRITDLAHEIGHLQSAHPARRHLPEFGLGRGYATVGDLEPDQRPAPYRTGKLEDHTACILAAYWTRSLGVSAIGESRAIRTIRPRAREWTSPQAREVAASALWLLEHWGLIDPHTDRPLARLRTVEDDPVLPRLRFEARFCEYVPNVQSARA